jgi:hypothetical protein
MKGGRIRDPGVRDGPSPRERRRPDRPLRWWEHWPATVLLLLLASSLYYLGLFAWWMIKK